MDSSGRADFFGTFLSRMAVGDGSASTSPSMAGNAERGVLKALADRGDALPVSRLVKDSEFPPSMTISALQSLENAKLIEIRDGAGDPLAALTSLGRKLG